MINVLLTGLYVFLHPFSALDEELARFITHLETFFPVHHSGMEPDVNKIPDNADPIS
jgi:hypothetical protein